MLFTLVHDNKKYDYYKFVLNKKGILVYFFAVCGRKEVIFWY